MRIGLALLRGLAILALGAQCNGQSSHCGAGDPDPSCTQPPDSATGCTSNDQCAAPSAVCDVAGTKTCVQCLAPDQTSACTGTAPLCGDDHTCRACASHAECAASAACLPDGSCAAESVVAYVDPAGTDNATCSKAMPCTEVVKALATGRPFVKFRGTTDEAVVVDSKTVTFLADPGAKLTRTNNGIILEIKGTSQVAIFDLEIDGASGGASGMGISMVSSGTTSASLERVKVTGSSGVGISVNGAMLTVSESTISGNAGGGITSSSGTLAVSQSTISGNTGGGISASGAMLTVSESTISGNAGGGITSSSGTLAVSQSTISGNTGGGISVTSSQFDLSNNLIVRNGGVTSSFGGVSIFQSSAGTRRFAFNTVAHNGGMTGAVTGVSCASVNQSVTFPNNIVYANQVGGGGTQVGGGGMCAWSYSNIGPDTVAGTGNINADPLFVNATQGNFHLTAGSPSKDVADPAATLMVDVDGDGRPQGGGRDMGADEIKP